MSTADVNRRVGKILRRASKAVWNQRIVQRTGMEPDIASRHRSTQTIQLEARTIDELSIGVERSVRHLINLLPLLLPGILKCRLGSESVTELTASSLRKLAGAWPTKNL